MKNKHKNISSKREPIVSAVLDKIWTPDEIAPSAHFEDKRIALWFKDVELGRVVRYAPRRHDIRDGWNRTSYRNVAARKLHSGTLVFTGVENEEVAMQLVATAMRIFSAVTPDATYFFPKEATLRINVNSMLESSALSRWEAYVLSFIPGILAKRPKDCPLFAEEFGAVTEPTSPV